MHLLVHDDHRWAVSLDKHCRSAILHYRVSAYLPAFAGLFYMRVFKHLVRHLRPGHENLSVSRQRGVKVPVLGLSLSIPATALPPWPVGELPSRHSQTGCTVSRETL